MSREFLSKMAGDGAGSTRWEPRLFAGMSFNFNRMYIKDRDFVLFPITHNIIPANKAFRLFFRYSYGMQRKSFRSLDRSAHAWPRRNTVQGGATPFCHRRIS